VVGKVEEPASVKVPRLYVADRAKDETLQDLALMQKKYHRTVQLGIARLSQKEDNKVRSGDDLTRFK
jgi:hypothetical protein